MCVRVCVCSQRWPSINLGHYDSISVQLIYIFELWPYKVINMSLIICIDNMKCTRFTALTLNAELNSLEINSCWSTKREKERKRMNVVCGLMKTHDFVLCHRQNWQITKFFKLPTNGLRHRDKMCMDAKNAREFSLAANKYQCHD